MPSSSAADSVSVPSASVLERAHSFVSEHKRVLLIGAAVVVAAGGIAYYASSSTSGTSPEDGDIEGGRKKKKRTNRKKKAGNGADHGPVIEEVEPQSLDDYIASTKGAENLSVQDRRSLATDLKLRGNKAYIERQFADAVECYNRAIEVTPEPDPVFYSNRAACYMYFPTPDYEKAVEDCTEALKINPKHERSVGRRGTALEKLGRFEEALRDFTAATLLTKFNDQKVAESVERVLKMVTEPKAREIMAKRDPRLPPHTFVDAYFGAFRPRPIPEFPEDLSTGDHTLKLALEATSAHDYAHALTLIHEAIGQGISFDAGRARALNLRGSFRFLMGDSQGAKQDLEAAIEAQPQFTQSYVKIASVHMEQGNSVDAFATFDAAVKYDSKDPDIYYHRGQVLFIMQEFKQAAGNYRKSLDLDPSFVFSHIQLAVAQYKSGQLSDAMATFRRALKAFPQRSEPFNYYGELLLDQKRFEDAIEKFDRAIEIEKSRAPPINVLAMVNKGLTLFQWKSDLAGAEKIIKEALIADPECEAAVATLAQISLQRGEVEQAMTYFQRQVELSRTEADIMNALQFMHAAKAQNEFARGYPDLAEAYRYAEIEQRATAAAGGPAAFM